ncbi:class I SAM-dependent methyltransferase [Chloroflexota bacterium]
MNKSEKFWDRIANQWEKQDSELDQDSIRTVENTKKHLNSSDIVLDYACGIGTMTQEIAANVKEIHAIDITSKMIAIAKRNAGERKIENIHFSQATIFDDRFIIESFNVILAFNILHLLEDIQQVMQRINELIKSGGLFISATPCLGEKMAFIGIFLNLLSKMGIVPNLKILKISDLSDSIVSANFEILETENLDHSLPNYFVVAKKL